MRTLRLTRIAVQAEGVRLRRRARRLVMQLVLAVIALPFLLAAFGFLEAAFWTFLIRHFQPEYCGLIIASSNILVSALLVVIAMAQGGDDRVALEAIQVRQRALESAGRTFTLAAIVGPVIGFLFDQFRRSRQRH